MLAKQKPQDAVFCAQVSRHDAERSTSERMLAKQKPHDARF
jgi:hypothetical protein